MGMAVSERAHFEAKISALEARIAAIESQLKQAEQKRGPGRPPKDKNATEAAD